MPHLLRRRAAASALALSVGLALPVLAAPARAAAEAGAAATTSKKKLSAHQKAKLRKKLMRQVKRNPKSVLSGKFIRAAAAADFKLPLTIRLNKPNTASNDTAEIDLGPSFGIKTVHLSGKVKASVTFEPPGSGAPFGQINIAMANASNPVGTMTTDPIGLLENPDVTGANLPAGCANFTSPHPLDVDLLANQVAGAGVNQNTVLRTQPLSLGLTGTGNGGVGNLFGPPGPDVDISMSLDSRIWSIFRTIDNDYDPDGPGGPLVPGALNCRQVYSGYTDNTLPAHLTGEMRITPAITSDGKLRLAKLTLGGPETNIEVAACLVPFTSYSGALANHPEIVQAPPNAPCNSPTSPLGLPTQTTPGAEAAVVAGTLQVTSLTAEAIIGDA